MLESFVPDMYYKSIYDIDYKKLKSMKIKLILMDLDNTMTPSFCDIPSLKLKELIYTLKELGFKVVIFSNCPKKMIAPFMTELCIDACAFAMKPKKGKYERIKNKLKYTEKQIACIGDQLLTDVYGANKAGMLSILVNPISTRDLVTTRINRMVENYIMSKLEKKDLFVRGNYYE